MVSENERLGEDRPDKIGGPLDQKIDTKVSHTVFFGIIGGMAAITLFIFGLLFTQLGSLNARTGDLEKDSAVIESRLNSLKK